MYTSCFKLPCDTFSRSCVCHLALPNKLSTLALEAITYVIKVTSQDNKWLKIS